ncbi:NAD(P)H-binding protein [uncultured Chitinophaga sp.]|jgi:Predicted nucleoside-diphosphate-sugar epimerases|uniref:NAD(P)H-binding protein n=1 Tax=uncultured Chitinophaga sp. TaxID=339340 RepID=UPI002616DB85|nr:NAD(P)H-binding protein [uncultured Chitinophaga sp.]
MTNTNVSTAKTILVTAATGKTGSRIFSKLNEMGWPVRSGSRNARPGFDWMDQHTWGPALQHIHTVYVCFHPDLAIPGAADIIRSFTETAVSQGVKKLVLLSGRGETAAQHCEQIIMEAGIDWTIVRASWFAQNFSEGYLVEPILAGHVALPAGDVGEPFIDVDDIADVAVAALTDDKHNGQVYEVTGPRLLTFRDAISEIAEATGRPIQYQQMSAKEYSEAIEGLMPKEFVDFLGYLFTEVLDGRNAKLADGVQKALGRTPADFSAYVRKTAATGVWNPQ